MSTSRRPVAGGKARGSEEPGTIHVPSPSRAILVVADFAAVAKFAVYPEATRSMLAVAPVPPVSAAREAK